MIALQEHNLHNFTFEQVQQIIGSRIETARMLQAAMQLQRAWRYHKKRKADYREWYRQD